MPAKDEESVAVENESVEEECGGEGGGGERHGECTGLRRTSPHVGSRERLSERC